MQIAIFISSFKKENKRCLGFSLVQVFRWISQKKQYIHDNNKHAIIFELVDSSDLLQFKGAWKFKKIKDGRSKLIYTVLAEPKGMIPVFALNWRMKEDIPLNWLSR